MGTSRAARSSRGAAAPAAGSGAAESGATALGATAPGGISYLTLRAGEEAAGEFVGRKSRFIAQLAHVEGEDDAAEFVATVRARHYDARHNVPTWILADGRERASDDGEPQRTAGAPTLEVLRGAGLANVCCVVTRYFGGTLLGPGGLVRAYATAAQRALSDARERGLLVEMTLVTHVEARVPYAMLDRVRDLAVRSGARETGADYAADVTLHLAFRAGEEAAFVDSMRELANGRDLCEVAAPRFAEL